MNLTRSLTSSLTLLRRHKLFLAAAAVAMAALAHSLLVLAAPKTQFAVFRSSSADWIVQAADQSKYQIQFGRPGDVPVARDYEGTGQAQIAVFRPSTWQWFIRTSTGTVTVEFGGDGNHPLPGDYLGLKRAQMAVYRPSAGEWLIRKDDGTAVSIQFGAPTDIAVPADYFGTGHLQIAVFRPSTGQWFLRKDDGTTMTLSWGINGDKPVPGDYLGLGHAQLAYYRPNTGEWWIRGDDGSATTVKFIASVDGKDDGATTTLVPVPADYSGIGRARIALFRPDTAEYLIRNDDGSMTKVPWGAAGDTPVPAAYGYATNSTTPPAAPSSLAAATNSQTQITLTWTDKSSDETAFKVERRTGTGSYALIASVAANTTTYADTGLTAATGYTYRVRAVNLNGPSDYTNEAAATTTQSPPAAPSNLAATANSQTQITVTWTDNGSDETGFKVERRTGTGSYAEIASVAANTTTYADTGLTASTSYTYRVRAVNGGVASAYSNEATATTQAAASSLSLDKDVQPIFTANCSCHSGPFATLGMDLSAGNAYKNTVNVDSQSVNLKRVKPGDPAHSFLYEKVSTDSPSAGDRMPAGGPNLSQQDIDKIRDWIQQGAKP